MCSNRRFLTLEITYTLLGSGVLFQQFRGACWSGNKAAAAIRTHIVQAVLHAVTAEGALKGADHGLGGIRRQILVAALAAWPHFQHVVPKFANVFLKVINEPPMLGGSSLLN